MEREVVKVAVVDTKGELKEIECPLSELLYLNSPTVYKKNSLNCLIFEDSVTCNYRSKFVKLKIVECCYLLQPVVSKMNFAANN